MENVSVHIIARNSMTSLPYLISTLSEQSYEDVVIRIIDNASSDQLTKYLQDNVPGVRLIRNARNIGTAKAHNQLIRMAIQSWKNADLNNQFVMMVGTDVTIEPNAISSMVCRLQEDSSLGAVGGKLLRMFDENIQDEALRERVQSDHIDSVGFEFSRSCRFMPRGAGEVDEEQYDSKLSVFAVPGSFVMLRASALLDVRYSEEEYMDNSFESGGEDFDLSWRLRHKGWGIEYVPGAVAYRYRGVYKNGEILHIPESIEKRNAFFTLWKNLTFWEGIRSATQLSFMCIKDAPSFISGVPHLSEMLKKRRSIIGGNINRSE